MQLLGTSPAKTSKPSTFPSSKPSTFSIMLAIINSRAKLPTDQAAILREFKTSYRTIFSTNPKTEKSKVQTYILHLAPAETSGVNVCAGAGNCKAICLHFAGNPVYMTAKQAARIRRTLAYVSDPKRFMRLLVCAILDKLNKHEGEELAFRLNGTSDIIWENVDFHITPADATFYRIKFGRILPIGKRNIFEVFNFMRQNTGENVTFYDYTKVKHNWAECQRLNYHLTFSFDGWDNTANLKIAKSALLAGVNVAAAFNLKRNRPLFQVLEGDNELSAHSLPITDGDLTDYRPSDPKGGHIIGLRFKLPHGIKYTAAEKMAFCIA
jgi:hypothetical protein